MRCFIADSNVPAIYWDFIVEHAALVNSMTYPSICDPDKTIFEAAWGVIPNIDRIPPLGCFCARLTDNTKARSDSKLDPKNEVGVFLGFATRKNTYGAQILVQKSVITAKQQIAYDIELFPFTRARSKDTRKTIPITVCNSFNGCLIAKPLQFQLPLTESILLIQLHKSRLIRWMKLSQLRIPLTMKR